MRSPPFLSSSSPTELMDSIVINDITAHKPTTTILHSPSKKTPHHHHMYNYWTLNERLRSKNEKLAQRQQSACRLAFYSLWLFILAGVMAIVVYRFTDDCSLPSIDQKDFLLQCFRNVLLLIALSLSFFACSGVIYGACRYFRSQPRSFLYTDEYELHLTPNYDVLPVSTRSHSYCCQKAFINGTPLISSQQMSNYNDEHSNGTVTSSIQNLSPQRKVPPFTYEELPASQSIYSVPLSPLPHININGKSSHANRKKSAFFSSSTSTSSSPQSSFSPTTIPNQSDVTNSNHNKRKSTLIFEDAYPSTPTSYTTCVCGTDVWERQRRPSIPLSPH